MKKGILIGFIAFLVGIIVGGCRIKQGRGFARRETQLVEDIAGGLDELGALLDQLVTAAGDWRMNRAGNGEYLTPLLGGQAGGDQ